jgi:hypothetical protein
VKSSSSRNVRAKRAKRAKLGPGGIAKLALAAAVALFAAWWIVRISAVDALVRRNPIAAAMVAPDNPKVKFALATAEFQVRAGNVSEASRRSALDALRQAPLADEPFLLAGVDALAKGDDRRGVALLTEARTRNPRARTPRLLLLDRYLRANRTAEAGTEIVVLDRLISRAAEVLVPELARMVGDPRTRPALMGVLRRDPGMQQAVLARLASSGDADLILKIAEATGGGHPAGPPPEWQPLLLAKLVEKGEIPRAYALWRRFAGIQASAPEGGLYDGRFKGLPGSPPFNWQLVAGSAGVAERRGAAGLDVGYYGRDRTDLASQLLMLRPGRYRLLFRAEGDASGQGSNLAWTLACRGGGETRLLEARLSGITYTPRTVAAPFVVPAGCGAQWLRLSGSPNEFPKAQNVTLTDLQIRPEGK